jgi:hypothetical protein
MGFVGAENAGKRLNSKEGNLGGVEKGNGR